jgi:hypothetical protein
MIIAAVTTTTTRTTTDQQLSHILSNKRIDITGTAVSQNYKLQIAQPS